MRGVDLLMNYNEQLIIGSANEGIYWTLNSQS